jgi:hypothetical protein
MERVTQNLEFIAMKAVAIIRQQMKDGYPRSDRGQDKRVVFGLRADLLQTLSSSECHFGLFPKLVEWFSYIAPGYCHS